MIEPIIFSFSPNASDYYKTLRAFMYRNRGTRTILFILILVFVISGFTSIALTHTFPIITVTTLLIVLSLIISFLFYSPASAAEKVNSDERLNAETAWNVDDAKISIKTKFAETNFDWGTFGDVYETSEHFMITYSTNKNMFQIIPKRAFSSAVQQDSFKDLLIAKSKSITRINSINLPELSKRTSRVLLYAMLAIFIIVIVITSYIQASNKYN